MTRFHDLVSAATLPRADAQTTIKGAARSEIGKKQKPLPRRLRMR